MKQRRFLLATHKVGVLHGKQFVKASRCDTSEPPAMCLQR